MSSEKVTFVLFMFNEEARVERAVRNFIGHGRILIVDCFSTDRTCEIAAALGADILKYQNQGWVEDEHTTSLIKATVKTPWIYWGFADEILGSESIKAMMHAVESGKYSIVNIMRKNYYYGEFVHDAHKSMQTRAFEKDAIDFTGNRIHHFGKPTVHEDRIKYLDSSKYFIHHFISNNSKSYNRSFEKYTDIEAATNAEWISPGTMLLKMTASFLVNYFVRHGRRAKTAGFYFALQMTAYQSMMAMKVYERQHGLTTEAIEARNNQVRDRLLAEIETDGCLRS